MGGAEAVRRFEEANRLWFREGRAVSAMAEYRAAAEADPDDPVVLFQLARALRAFEREDEGRDVLSRALEHADRLSPRGAEILAREARGGSGGFRAAFPVELSALDADVLEARGLPPEGWLAVGDAAEERGMYGLAAAAYARAGGVRELYDDEREMQNRAAAEVNRLNVMRGTGSRPEGPPATRPPAPPAEPSPARPAPPPPPVPAPGPSTSTRPAATVAGVPDDDALVPAAPLALEARADPGVSEVEEPVWLTVTLSNRGDRPVAVNRRLLLAAPGAAFGEVSVEVRGPPGYENNTRFRVHAGAPGAADFGVLHSGESVTRRYPLDRYESLDVPGRYTATVTYRNTAGGELDGLPVVAGSVTSPEFTFERRPEPGSTLPAGRPELPGR